MKSWRKKLSVIIEPFDGSSRLSRAYDVVMMVIILVSIIPMLFSVNYPVFRILEIGTVSVFILDYLFRWMTADYKLGKGGVSFLLYPFTLIAIIALPSGVITASYMDEIRKGNKPEE